MLSSQLISQQKNFFSNTNDKELMHPKNDHYEVLGLQRGATKKQIILAFNEKSEEFEND